jgi:tetratricopeptide (TPR) repeat protein
LINEGRLNDARSILKKEFGDTTNDPHALLLFGIIEFRCNNFNRAREIFNEILTKKRNDFLATYYLGLTLERSNDLEGAVAAFMRAAAIRPDAPEPLEKVKRYRAATTGILTRTGDATVYKKRYKSGLFIIIRFVTTWIIFLAIWIILSLLIYILLMGTGKFTPPSESFVALVSGGIGLLLYGLGRVLIRRRKGHGPHHRSVENDENTIPPRDTSARSSGPGGGPSGEPTKLKIPTSQQSLGIYREWSRRRAKADWWTDHWYGLPWPVRIFKLLMGTLSLAICLAILGVFVYLIVGGIM